MTPATPRAREVARRGVTPLRVVAWEDERVVSRPGGFVVLLPVKSPGTAKSRLSAVAVDQRTMLAGAFARDAVAACLASDAVARVLVVSDDAAFARRLAALGADTCADAGGGLNAALRQGADAARVGSPQLQPVALCADLPAVRPEELTQALSAAASSVTPCFVADADGTGTTLYTATYDAFEPRFGPDSAAAHAAGGAVALAGEMPGLRRDVDDLGSLAEAADLGVGPATAAVLAAMRLPR
ncbi:2-phospho-L-lactate guanylyltransferase [Nocardioides sp. SYSU DS0651]|uniref:2-phospho-L-lactate guanylyltransferase n=1 Tax=Nocardioides sp. SYSU DS0651 TaxID=3415955 RepID=UPI003F4C160B